MLFNSYIFIFVFLPFTFFAYFFLNKKRLTEASKGFLVLSSLFFYSWWNIAYLPLILVSMLFNYVLGKQFTKDIFKGKRYLNKSLLIFGVISNLSLLGYFQLQKVQFCLIYDFKRKEMAGNFKWNIPIPCLITKVFLC